jgi:hypothetical protein
MSTIKLDQLYMHSDDIGEVVGDFHSTPIFHVDFSAVYERETLDARRRYAAAKAYARKEILCAAN